MNNVNRAGCLLALLLAGACSQSQAPEHKTGWHVFPERGGYEGSLSFEFGDSAKTAFVAKCNGSPWFMLLGGDYPTGTQEFTLVADDTSWKLPAFQGEHGGGLFVEQAHLRLPLPEPRIELNFQWATGVAQ